MIDGPSRRIRQFITVDPVRRVPRHNFAELGCRSAPADLRRSGKSEESTGNRGGGGRPGAEEPTIDERGVSIVEGSGKGNLRFLCLLRPSESGASGLRPPHPKRASRLRIARSSRRSTWLQSASLPVAAASRFAFRSPVSRARGTRDRRHPGIESRGIPESRLRYPGFGPRSSLPLRAPTIRAACGCSGRRRLDR